MNKNELRKKYLELRKQILEKDEKSKIIMNKLIMMEEYISSSSIGLYYSLSSEVNTLELINYALNEKKRVFLPRVEGDNIVFYEIKSMSGLVKSNFGVMEPISGNIADKNNIDLIIVPGVCFDKSLNRIGFGKGYYDRYLSDYKGETIGISFEEQMSSELIETESTDKKLKYIVTEKNIYS